MVSTPMFFQVIDHLPVNSVVCINPPFTDGAVGFFGGAPLDGTGNQVESSVLLVEFANES